MGTMQHPSLAHQICTGAPGTVPSPPQTLHLLGPCVPRFPCAAGAAVDACAPPPARRFAAFRTRGKQHMAAPAGAAGADAVHAAAEAPSSWLAGADPVLAPIGAFFETFGWPLVALALAVLLLRPYVNEWLAARERAASLADATRPDRVATLDVARREAFAAREAALREEAAATAERNKEKKKKREAAAEKRHPLPRGGGGSGPVRWSKARAQARKRSGG